MPEVNSPHLQNSPNGQNFPNMPNFIQWMNGSGWGFGASNMPNRQSGSNTSGTGSSGSSSGSTTNQLSCGNNWPSSSYMYITITPPPGFTQISARKMASALQNNNWNFQGYQASAPIQKNVGYIDQNGILQPFGYRCNQPLQPNTIVEIIGPMT
jgi:hypothetical protein